MKNEIDKILEDIEIMPDIPVADQPLPDFSKMTMREIENFWRERRDAIVDEMCAEDEDYYNVI